VDLEAAQEICLKIFANSLHPSWYRKHFFKGNIALPPGAFHDALPEFPVYFEIIQSCLWYICKQLEPKEEDYHKLFNTLLKTFDQLLAIANEKLGEVHFVDQSGQANVKVKKPMKKQKTKHTPHCIVLRKHNLRQEGFRQGGFRTTSHEIVGYRINTSHLVSQFC